MSNYWKKITKQEVENFLAKCSSETKVYFGCDSVRYKIKGIWYGEYTTVLVVHINGSRGCKIFGQIDKERDFDKKASKPILRLMNEAYRVSQLYLDFKDVIEDYETQVHLDINTEDIHNSSIAVSQASGYVKGVCNVTPILKTCAYAASYAADRLKSIA